MNAVLRVVAYAVSTSVGLSLAFLIVAWSGPTTGLLAAIIKYAAAVAVLSAIVLVSLRIVGTSNRADSSKPILLLAGALPLLGIGLAFSVSMATSSGFAPIHGLIPLALLSPLALVQSAPPPGTWRYTLAFGLSLIFVGPLVFAAVIALAHLATTNLSDQQFASLFTAAGGGGQLVNLMFAAVTAIWNLVVVLGIAGPIWWIVNSRATAS